MENDRRRGGRGWGSTKTFLTDKVNKINGLRSFNTRDFSNMIWAGDAGGWPICISENSDTHSDTLWVQLCP